MQTKGVFVYNTHRVLPQEVFKTSRSDVFGYSGIELIVFLRSVSRSRSGPPSYSEELIAELRPGKNSYNNEL